MGIVQKFPWTLDALLQVTHQPQAVSGFLSSPPDRCVFGPDISLWTDRDPEQGKFTQVSLAVVPPPTKEPVSPAVIRELAEQFGGDAYFRVYLHTSPLQSLLDFLDISFHNRSFAGQEYNHQMEQLAPHRLLLESFLPGLGVEYQAALHHFYILPEQPKLDLRPKTIEQAYTFLLSQGYLPSLSSGSAQRNFLWSQSRGYDNVVRHHLHLNVGKHSSREPLPAGELDLLQRTAEQHGRSFDAAFAYQSHSAGFWDDAFMV